jgi:hypothetical protein
MFLLELPTEVLGDILSYNIIPYTSRVCRELSQIEYSLYSTRCNIVKKKYYGLIEMIHNNDWDMFIFSFYHRNISIEGRENNRYTSNILTLLLSVNMSLFLRIVSLNRYDFDISDVDEALSIENLPTEVIEVMIPYIDQDMADDIAYMAISNRNLNVARDMIIDYGADIGRISIRMYDNIDSDSDNSDDEYLDILIGILY